MHPAAVDGAAAGSSEETMDEITSSKFDPTSPLGGRICDFCRWLVARFAERRQWPILELHRAAHSAGYDWQFYRSAPPVKALGLRCERVRMPWEDAPEITVYVLDNPDAILRFL